MSTRARRPIYGLKGSEIVGLTAVARFARFALDSQKSNSAAFVYYGVWQSASDFVFVSLFGLLVWS